MTAEVLIGFANLASVKKTVLFQLPHLQSSTNRFDLFSQTLPTTTSASTTVTVLPSSNALSSKDSIHTTSTTVGIVVGVCVAAVALLVGLAVRNMKEKEKNTFDVTPPAARVALE